MNKLLEKQKLAFYYPYFCPSCKILCDTIVTLLIEFPDISFKEIADVVKGVRAKMSGRNIILKEAQKVLKSRRGMNMPGDERK